MKEIKKGDKKSGDGLLDAAVTGASADTVSRYGSAAKEHIVAYTGVDNEAGKTLKKGLRDIARSKINPEYAKSNLKQQAGFAAELKDAARTNAERAINGDPVRKVRTDDLGRVNDPLYDHLEVDGAGNPVAGSGSQMKFVGGSPEEAWAKLNSGKFQKYHEANVPIEVPADHYDGIIKKANEDIASLERQSRVLEARGDRARAAQLKERAAELKKIKGNIRKSKVSTREAMEARTDPGLSTLKDIGSVSHRAGLEAGKMGAVVGGGVAIVQNMYLLVKGDIKFEEAAKNVAVTAAKGSAAGYATGFCGSAAKGLMQNSGSGAARALAKTNLPGIAATVALETSKTMLRYFRGEISGTQCLNELGEKGTGMVSSAMFATIGQAAIPIPVVGGLIGGMVGYAISSASYGILTSALNEASLAREERQRIERECEEHVRMLRDFRSMVQKTINTYLAQRADMFASAFEGIKGALEIGDIDGFIASSNIITKGLGKEAIFGTMDEFEDFMESDKAFKF